jgi:hypothetical protein
VASRLLGVPRARDQRRTEDKGRIAPQMHDYSHKSPNTRSTKYSSSHLVSLRFRQAKGINLTSFFLRSPQISRPLPVNEVGRCSSEDRQIEDSSPSSSRLQSRTPAKIAVPLHKTAAQGLVVEGCVCGGRWYRRAWGRWEDCRGRRAWGSSIGLVEASSMDYAD